MTKLEASMTQLVNKAASGDLKAMKVLMQMASRFDTVTGDTYRTGSMESWPLNSSRGVYLEAIVSALDRSTQ